MSKGEWTHSVCSDCFRRWTGKEPITSVKDDLNRCCLCGEFTDEGIYLRDDPQVIHPRKGKR